MKVTVVVWGSTGLLVLCYVLTARRASGSPSRPAVSPGSAASFALDPIGSPRPTKLPDCASAHLGPQHSWSVVWLHRGRACGPPLAPPQLTQGGHFGRPGSSRHGAQRCARLASWALELEPTDPRGNPLT